jgi:hypothetical protein
MDYMSFTATTSRPKEGWSWHCSAALMVFSRNERLSERHEPNAVCTQTNTMAGGEPVHFDESVQVRDRSI